MKFKEYDTVRIMKDCDEGIKRSTIGAILIAFEEPREAYEVDRDIAPYDKSVDISP